MSVTQSGILDGKPQVNDRPCIKTKVNDIAEECYFWPHIHAHGPHACIYVCTHILMSPYTQNIFKLKGITTDQSSREAEDSRCSEALFLNCSVTALALSHKFSESMAGGAQNLSGWLWYLCFPFESSSDIKKERQHNTGVGTYSINKTEQGLPN